MIELEKKLFSIVALAESVEADASLSERVVMADFRLLWHLMDFQNSFLLEGFKFLRWTLRDLRIMEYTTELRSILYLFSAL